jgi:hypothetical protein
MRLADFLSPLRAPAARSGAFIPTANSSRSNGYWVPQAVPSNGLVFKPRLVPPDRDELTIIDLTEMGSITERVLAQTLGAKLSTILH